MKNIFSIATVSALSIALACLLPACAPAWYGSDPVHEAEAMIDSGAAECVLVKNGLLVKNSGHGVSPLLEFYEKQPDALKDSVVVDKVIGRAAAAIAIKGGAKAVYGLVMSEDGKAYLEKYGVQAHGRLTVPRILNRKRDGLCPLEASVEGIDDPAIAIASLKRKIESFKKK